MSKRQSPQTYTDRVRKIIAFCESLTVPDGMLAGQKVVLQPEQKAFINAVYGPRHPDGIRKVRRALLTMGRKNGKTGLIAMLLLVHICGPEAIRNGQIYSVALDREQASQVFGYAEKMVFASDVLCNRLNVTDSMKRITDPVSGSMYKALSKDSRSKLGKSTSVVIFDEGAQFGRDRRLHDAMATSTSAHAAPLSFYISTQAENDQAWFSELVDYGKKVNAGEIEDETFVAFIYEVPADADPWDEKNWFLANPCLGVFKNLETMRDMANQARRLPSFESAFRNLELNQRISAEAPFIPAEVWKANGDEPVLDVFEDAECWGGLDLSAKNDLTALVLVAQNPDDHKWEVRPFLWTPKDNIRDRSDRDRVPYDVWAREGYLAAVDGRVIDYGYVAAQIAELHGEYNIAGIKFDRWRIDFLCLELAKIGVDAWIEGKEDPIPGGLRLIPHGQGFKDFNPAVERLEDLLIQERIRHGNHPVLTMCAANTRVTIDPSGNRKFDKIKSTGRIDGLVALAMALNWTQEPDEDGQGDILDFYQSEPFVVEFA